MCLLFIAIQQKLIAYTTLIHSFRNKKKCLLRGMSLIVTYNSGLILSFKVNVNIYTECL